MYLSPGRKDWGMQKKLLSIVLSFVLIFIYVFPPRMAGAFSAADPNIKITIAPSQTQTNALLLSITGLSGKVKTIDYTITYQSGGGTKGVKATGVDVNGQDAFTRDLYLGTCSKNVCTPDPDVSKGTITLDFINADATTSELSGDIAFGASTTIQNQASVANTVASSASSGNNLASSSGNIATPSATPTATPSATTTTGDAVSLTQGENSVNTAMINAQVLNQTLNLYIPQTGNVNLTIPSADVLGAILSGHPDDATISAVLTGINSFAYLTNSIHSLANTGGNSIHTDGSAQAATGNAYSVVSLLNKVNTTFIDSVVHFITVNIFTNVIGNILLPEGSTNGSGTCCGKVVNVNNDAKVTNTITSSATSGENTVMASGSAIIVTGGAQSSVNVLNLVNQTFIDASIFDLWINTMGNWRGNFRGWNALGPTSGGGSVALTGLNPQVSDGSGCPTCTGDVNLTNSATVNNTISSLANTGGNNVTGNEGAVKTGNAFSSVSLINLVNTTFIRSLGWFGFVNIFGSLDGDIGGASLFPTPTPSPAEALAKAGTPTSEGSHTSNVDQSQTHDTGGLLAITQTNNVGAYVLPGDTVTFFIKAKNIGSGHVYNTKVDLILLKDGIVKGGATFNAGNIDPGKGVKITTGLVLSPHAEGGTYTARAIIHGVVGPDDHKVSATTDSSFTIHAFQTTAVGSVQGSSTNGPQAQVMGVTEEKGSTRMEDQMKIALAVLAAIYFSIEGLKRRRQIVLAFYKASAYGFRLFL